METIEQFLSRGGKIEILPPTPTSSTQMVQSKATVHGRLQKKNINPNAQPRLNF